AKAEQAWLDDAVHACQKTFNKPTGHDAEAEHLDEFFENISRDNRGRLVIAKYRSTIEACQCRHELDGLRFIIYGEDNECPIFQLDKRWHALEEELNEQWLLRTRVAGMRSEGGIPPRQH